MPRFSQRLVLYNHAEKKVTTLPFETSQGHGVTNIRGTSHGDHQDGNLTPVISHHRNHVKRTTCLKTEANPKKFIYNLNVAMIVKNKTHIIDSITNY